jgi:multidrug transporter EmrE-like cation transporter
MNFPAFALVDAAACLHAFWNLTAKRVSGNVGVFWLGQCLGAIVLAPLAVSCAGQSFDLAGVPYLLTTAVIHTAYFTLLAAGYRRGELSIVYPLARGSGVAGTALVAGTLLAERISIVGGLGIGAVCLGILLLGLRERRGQAHSRTWLPALQIGLTITGYSVVD